MTTSPEARQPGSPGAEGDHLRALGDSTGLPVLEHLPAEILDASLIKDLSLEWARTHCLLPVTVDGQACVLTADPDQVAPQEYLALLLGRELQPILASRALILAGIEQCYYSRESSPGDFLKDLARSEGPPVTATIPASADLLQVATEAPVTQLVNLILLEAVKRRASDIHFEPFESRLRVRYRIDGVLYEQAGPPKHLEESLVSRLKVMARMDIAEKRLPQDGMARVRVGEREIDVRVSTIPVAEGERMVLRLLDSRSALLPLSALGMAEGMRATFEHTLTGADGMVVVCGPTGAGKTTTLYAALGLLDASRRNILTIEDPIEYQLSNIGQMQVKPKIGLTFSNGLRHILRQDPDVILVGETRDLETAEIAIRSALTGHLVFTTLHTSDAPGVILRLMDMGVPAPLLAACLRSVLAQRLVRRLCPVCKRSTLVAGVARGVPSPMMAAMAGRPTWEPVGCGECLEGFKGRLGLFEFMPVGDSLREAMRSGASGLSSLRRVAAAAGMVTLQDDAQAKVLAGQTSLAEVLAVLA
ncbi:MAG: GspE/PulE family protein [Verrucomicrobia bacterium]|nr:GspE/PulE family protein [Verrucomicrobiota bacterium]